MDNIINSVIHSKKVTSDSQRLREIEEKARNIVINTVNLAKERIGIRQALEELAGTASYGWVDALLSMKSIVPPISTTAERFIIDTIENQWYLAKIFKYRVVYRGVSSDEAYKYYYFEAIFSQPTANYPEPQATGSVFFRIEDRKTDDHKTPLVFFRVEGHHVDHDVRHVALNADWILALIRMKLLFFRRIEALRHF